MISADTLRSAISTPGFTEQHHLEALDALIREHAARVPGDIVEIGAYCGRSTVVLADVARDLGCKVVVIDLFPAKLDWERGYTVTTDGRELALYPHGIEECAKHGVELARREIAVNQFAEFLQAIEGSGFRDEVHVARDEAWAFLTSFPTLKIRAAFIDGDHSYEAVVRDIRAVHKNLSPDAIVVLDDYDFPGVARAIADMLTPANGYTRIPGVTALYAARFTPSTERGAP